MFSLINRLSPRRGIITCMNAGEFTIYQGGPGRLLVHQGDRQVAGIHQQPDGRWLIGPALQPDLATGPNVAHLLLDQHGLGVAVAEWLAAAQLPTAAQVRAWRKAQGLTATQLGALVGKCKRTVYNFESGARPLDPTVQGLVWLLMRDPSLMAHLSAAQRTSPPPHSHTLGDSQRGPQ